MLVDLTEQDVKDLLSGLSCMDQEMTPSEVKSDGPRITELKLKLESYKFDSKLWRQEVIEQPQSNKPLACKPVDVVIPQADGYSGEVTNIPYKPWLIE